MRVVLMMLIMGVAQPAWAEWTKVATVEDAVVYIDAATIRKDGNLRRVWELQDMKQRNTNGMMSSRALSEYDCAEEKRRNLAISAHTGPMASGETIGSFNITTEWVYIAPHSIDSTIFKIVCGP